MSLNSIVQVEQQISQLKNETAELHNRLQTMRQNPDMIVDDCCRKIEEGWRQQDLTDFVYPLAMTPCAESRQRHLTSSDTIERPCGQASCRCIAMSLAILDKCRGQEIPVESVCWSENKEDWYTRFYIKINPISVSSLITDGFDITDVYQTLPPRIQKLCRVVTGDKPHLLFELNYNRHLIVIKLRDGDYQLHLCRGDLVIWDKYHPREGRRIAPQDLVGHVDELREID